MSKATRRRDGRCVGAVPLSMVVLLLVATTPRPAPAAGDDDRAAGRYQLTSGLTVGGSVRLRAENRDGFRFDEDAPGNDEDFLLTQVRLDLQWSAGSRVDGLLELQDSRIFSETFIDEDAVPNIFADDLDVHRAFLDVDVAPVGSSPVRLRLGRQKLNLGDLRLVASLEWVNTARVHDGVRLTLQPGEERTLDLFATHLVPVDPRELNDHGRTPSRLFNSEFHGAFFTDESAWDGGRLDAWALLRRESVVDDRVVTLGARLVHTSGPWSVEGQAAVQTGRYGGDSHRAGMLHVEAGRTLGRPEGSRLSVGYSYGSGDGDPSDDRHETFDNLFPLNHAYYGYMDFFSLQNVHNGELVWKGKVGRVTLRSAYHEFWLAEEDTDAWYNAGAGPVRRATSPVDAHVGRELDLTAAVGFRSGRVALLAGYSRFFPGAYIRGSGTPEANAADFSFLQVRVRH